VRLQLHALAYNLANFMRTLALPEAIKQWSLTSLREKLVKIARSDPRPPSGLPVVAAVVRAAPPLAKHRIFVKISASLGVIRGIPDQSFPCA
jgi:hypothetical protein